MQPQPNPNSTDLMLGDVNDVARAHPAYRDKTGAIRGLIARKHENGLAPHIYKVGRRVLIDLNGFERWIREQQEAAR